MPPERFWKANIHNIAIMEHLIILWEYLTVLLECLTVLLECIDIFDTADELLSLFQNLWMLLHPNSLPSACLCVFK